MILLFSYSVFTSSLLDPSLWSLKRQVEPFISVLFQQHCLLQMHTCAFLILYFDSYCTN